jgi:hypothetical protein
LIPAPFVFRLGIKREAFQPKITEGFPKGAFRTAPKGSELKIKNQNKKI